MLYEALYSAAGQDNSQDNGELSLHIWNGFGFYNNRSAFTGFRHCRENEYLPEENIAVVVNITYSLKSDLNHVHNLQGSKPCLFAVAA